MGPRPSWPSQGSVLAPLLYIIYTSELGPRLTDCALLSQLYADDVQAYLHCLASAAMAAVQAMTLATGAAFGRRWPGCPQIDCGSIHLRPNTSGWAHASNALSWASLLWLSDSLI